MSNKNLKYGTIIIFIIIVIIGTLSIFDVFPKLKNTEKIEKRYDIKQLYYSSENEKSGSFASFLLIGGGDLTEKNEIYYTFYRGTDDYGYQLERIRFGRDFNGIGCVKIYEGENIKPYSIFKESYFYNSFGCDDGYWELHIPSNSIKYEIDINITSQI
jgi:hypothetical protein